MFFVRFSPDISLTLTSGEPALLLTQVNQTVSDEVQAGIG